MTGSACAGEWRATREAAVKRRGTRAVYHGTRVLAESWKALEGRGHLVTGCWITVAVLMLLWIDGSCMIKGAVAVLPFAVLREGVGGRPTMLGTEIAASSAAQGTLECRNKDVRSLRFENLRCNRSICRFCKLLIGVSHQTTAK